LAEYEAGSWVCGSRRVHGRGWDVKVGFRVVFVDIGRVTVCAPWSKNGIPPIFLWIEWEMAKSCR